MLSPSDVRVLDINSAALGVATSRLMRNAGKAVAQEALARFHPQRVLVLAGPGNNGGDGAVAAQDLARQGLTVTVLYTRDPQTLSPGDARGAFERLDRQAVRVETYRSPQRLKELLSQSDLVIDALLGVGQAGSLRAPIDVVVKTTNASNIPVLAVDVPTGLGGRLVLRAKRTVTLHDRKPGLTGTVAGAVTVADIGIPEGAHEIGPGDLAIHYPVNPPGRHKGQNGRVALFAGGPYTGAALLATESCLRTGADLVHLWTSQRNAAAARAHLPDAIVHPGTQEEILTLADAEDLASTRPLPDVVVLGPGLGKNAATSAAVQHLLRWTQSKKIPTLLDAEALTVAGRHPKLLRGRPVLATPHPEEFRRLTGHGLDKDPTRAAQAQAKRLGITIVAKSDPALITDGRHTRYAPPRPSWMTVGGTGDVLTGAAAALMAKGLEPFRAASVAIALGREAARIVFETQSWSARASDLPAAFGAALRHWVPEVQKP